MNQLQAPLSLPQHNSEWSGAGRSSPGAPSPKPQQPSPYGRGNLPTPPISAHSSNGMNGPFSGMNGRPPNYDGRPAAPYAGGGAPSPPSSVARSSNGTQMSEHQRRKQGRLEQDLAEHFRLLKPYANGGPGGASENGRPNRARDKLTRLSSGQFQELSQDVFDELRRRQEEVRVKEYNSRTSDRSKHRKAPPFLISEDQFHPKRNQARQKLSTLPPPRFRALAADVTYELEQRFPQFAGEPIGRTGSPGMPPGRMGSPGPMGMGRRGPPRNNSLGGQIMAPGMGPQQKSSQSNTVVPNKSYLVEEDDGDLDSVYGNRRDTTQTTKSYAVNDKIMSEYQGEIDNLKDKIKGLEQSSLDKDDQISKLEGNNRGSEAEAEWARLRTDLEDKVADAQSLNDRMQLEIDKMKAQHRERELNLQGQVDIMNRKGNDDGEWKTRYNEVQQVSNSLKRENQDLQDAVKEQQMSSATVRKELEGFLSEMKSIQQRHDQGFQREERLSQQVQMLETDLRLWKNRCAKMKTQLRTAQTGSVMLTQPDVVRDAFVRPNGLIQHIHLTTFQLAIDETLRVARGGEATVLQETLKTAVTAVRDICQDVPESSAADAKKQRGKVSAMANNFITATKNFVASKGISPVSLLDAAASNLSTAVVDLVSIVKMRPSANGDLDFNEVSEEMDDDLDMVIPEPGKPNKYYSTNGRSSMSESVYSTTTAPRASERFQTLPMSTYQDPRSSRAPSANGVANGLNKAGHRAQLSVTSQSSYNSQPPPRMDPPSFNGRPSFGAMSNESSRQPSFNSSAQPAFLNFSNASNTTTATENSLAPPIPMSAKSTTSQITDALKEFSEELPELSSRLTGLISVMVESIRTSHQPVAVRDNALQVIEKLSAILDKMNATLLDNPAIRSQLDDALQPIEKAKIDLGVSFENASAVIDSGQEKTGAWNDCVRAFPRTAFQVVRDVNNLAERLKDVVEVTEDFS